MSALWDVLDKVGILVGLFTGLVTVAIWVHLRLREKKDNALIAVSLVVPDRDFKVVLPSKIRRKNLTRAEIQGMLGILPMNEPGKRYQLSSLNDAAFFSQLEQAQVNGEVQEISIVCNDDDLLQFDTLRLKNMCQ